MPIVLLIELSFDSWRISIKVLGSNIPFPVCFADDDGDDGFLVARAVLD
jgi:hypothetical protein